MPDAYVLDQVHRKLGVGHLRLFIEDNLRGLDSSFVDSIDLKSIVHYAMGSMGTGSYENPCTYILHSLTVDYLRLTKMNLSDIALDAGLYDHIYKRLQDCFNSICPGFINYLKLSMNHNEPRDFRIVQWTTDESIVVSKLKEYDPSAF